MKEIGVRKVLGASIGHIIVILNTRFAIILLIALVIGSVASHFLANGLMDSIWKYHVSPGVITFAASAFILVTVTSLTIGFKIYNAARMNPVSTLRTE